MDSDNLLTEDEWQASNDYIQENLVSLTSRTIATLCFPHFKANTSVVDFLRMESGASASKKIMRVLNSGSTAELYIRPFVKCTGDRDIMCFNRNSIVVQSEDVTFPKMEHRFEDTVKCLRMIPDQRFPCFVRLELTGEFRYSWDLKSFVFHKENSTTSCQFRPKSYNHEENPGIELKTVGPALTLESKREHHDPQPKNNPPAKEEILLAVIHPTDYVTSYHCPTWPDSATEWTVRKRPHGCPDSATVDEIVRSGCDIVNVSHPDCREDQYLMRLSFSRAEVVLINKWSHTQQVVFHMLRYFAKKELIRDGWEGENKILCTYHVKTLMLWSCESEAREFWENHVIEICCFLLKTLSSWLQRKVCQNYFVPDCNLFSHIRNENNRQEVIDKLGRFQSSRALAEWFRLNYIDQSSYLKSFELYESLKPTVGDSAALQKCFGNDRGEAESIEEVIGNFRRIMELHELKICISLLFPLLEMKPNRPVTEPMPCLSQNMGISCADYTIALQILLLAKHLTVKSISSVDQVYDYIAAMYKQFEVHDFPITYTEHLPSSKLCLITAEELMSGLSGQTTDNEDKLLTELSIQCLKKSLNLCDSIEDDDYPVTTIYLASLYFKLGQYQKMGELCSNLLAEGVSAKQKAKAQLLVFLKDVSDILGFVKLWTHVRKRKAETNDSDVFSFSPKIFARYLLVLCVHEQNFHSHNRFFQHPTSFATISDEILMATIERRMKRHPSVKAIQEDPSLMINSCGETSANGEMSQEDLIALLMDIFCDRLRSTFQIIRNDFGCVDCFGDILPIALYRYRRRQYGETLRLCELFTIVDKMKQQYHKEPCIACMFSRPFLFASHIDLFFDNDIQIIIGLRLLQLSVLKLNPHLCYSSKISKYASKDNQQTDPDFEWDTWDGARFFIESGFLAKYLRLRCLLDTDRPIDEILDAYRSLLSLPCRPNEVETIIIGFMRKKIQIYAKRLNSAVDLSVSRNSDNSVYKPSLETEFEFGKLYSEESLRFIKQRATNNLIRNIISSLGSLIFGPNN